MKVEIDFKVTPEASVELKRALEVSGGGESLVRVLVQEGGCSGRSFGLALIPESDINPDVDVVEDIDGLRLVIDRKSLLSLDGTIIEWIESPTKGFRFNAPKSKSSCGCKKGGSCSTGA